MNYKDPQNEDQIPKHVLKQIKEYKRESESENSHPCKINCTECGQFMYPGHLFEKEELVSIIEDDQDREHEEIECPNCKTLLTVNFEITITTKRAY